LASFLLLAVPGRRLGVLEYIYLAINLCSSPLSLILLPILITRAVREKSLVAMSLFVLTLSYCAMVILGFPDAVTVTSDIYSPAAELSMTSAVAMTLPAIVDRVFFEPIFTNWVRLRLIYANLHSVVLLIGAGVAVLLVVPIFLFDSIRERVVELKEFLAWGCYFVFGATLLSIYARFGEGSGYDYRDAFHHRYFWTQICVVAISVSAVYGSHLSKMVASRSILSLIIVPSIVVGAYLESFEFDLGLERDESTRDYFESYHDCVSHLRECKFPMILDLGSEEFKLEVKGVP
jgi:hypothetical protein